MTGIFAEADIFGGDEVERLVMKFEYIYSVEMKTATFNGTKS